jgi:hypothetical protein
MCVLRAKNPRFSAETVIKHLPKKNCKYWQIPPQTETAGMKNKVWRSFSQSRQVISANRKHQILLILRSLLLAKNLLFQR